MRPRVLQASVCNFGAAELQHFGAIVGYEQGVHNETKGRIVNNLGVGQILKL